MEFEHQVSKGGEREIELLGRQGQREEKAWGGTYTNTRET
jgi:hypothetical protein